MKIVYAKSPTSVTKLYFRLSSIDSKRTSYNLAMLYYC